MPKEDMVGWCLVHPEQMHRFTTTGGVASPNLLVVLLRPPNFHCHYGGWLSTTIGHSHRGVLVFSVVFLGAVSWKLPPTIPQSSNSHLNVA